MSFPRCPLDSPPGPGLSRGPARILVRKRVLVVDDEDCVTELVADALGSQGYEVTTASDGDEALRGAIRYRPHLLVLDVMMPKENGYRVSRRLKTGEGADPDSPPKVLLLTGRRLDDDPDREKIFMEFSRADAILYKPFELNALLESVHRLIGDSVADPPA